MKGKLTRKNSDKKVEENIWTSGFFSRMKRRKNDEHGAILIVAALCLIVFLSVASFAVDLGLVYYQKSNLQNALDSAALAAAPYLPDQSRASAVALEYVEKNGYSAESAVIEFPEENVIRVTESSTAKTIFATLFNVDSVNYTAKAAAKFVNKSMNLDFEYLMFSGSHTQPLNLGGHYSIYGSVFGNSNLNSNGGSGSFIEGAAVSAGTCYINQWSTSVGTSASNVQPLNMPQWDDLIMTMVPSMDISVFNTVYTHCQPGSKDYYTGDLTCKNGTSYYLTNTYVGGNLKMEWSSTAVVWGDMYIEGNADIQGALFVSGNLYVNGKLEKGATYPIEIWGDMFVGGDAVFSAELKVNKNVYVVGNFKKNGGSFSLTVGKNVYTKGTVSWSNGSKVIGGGVYVYGQGAAENSVVASLGGPLMINGNVYCGNGGTDFNTKLDLTGQGGYRIVGTVYSAGSILTSQGGNGIEVDGCLIAEKDISIGGTTHTYTNVGTLSIYSRHGNITLQSASGGFDLWGIIYAPEGNIALNSGGFEIYGNIVAQTITCYPGGLELRENTRSLPYAKKTKAALLVE